MAFREQLEELEVTNALENGLGFVLVGLVQLVVLGLWLLTSSFAATFSVFLRMERS